MKQSDYNNQPFNIRKGEVKIYRLIFLGLGTLFFGLTFLLFRQSPVELYNQLFPSFGIMKWVVTFISLLFCISSFVIFATMKTEYEVLRQILRSARTKLHRIYLHKHAKFGPFTSFSTDVEERQKSYALKHQYHTLIEEMEVERDSFYLKLQKINNDVEMGQDEKEEQFNTLLTSFKLKLDQLIDRFEEVS